jgi:hypothetical protein
MTPDAILAFFSGLLFTVTAFRIFQFRRVRKARALLDWAETLICNATPMSHCTQEEWDEGVTRWRDQKHEV